MHNQNIEKLDKGGMGEVHLALYFKFDCKVLFNYLHPYFTGIPSSKEYFILILLE
jgi:hypothetical protein